MDRPPEAIEAGLLDSPGSAAVELPPSIAGQVPPEGNAPRVHYADLFRLAADPLLVTDRAGILREVNGAGVELLGVDRSPGTPLAAAIHPEDATLLASLLARATPTVERVRLRFRARTGRVARAGVRVATSRDGRDVLWMARLERAGTPAEGIPSLAVSQGAVDQERLRGLTAELAVAERRAVMERMARENAESQERARQWTMAIVAHSLQLEIDWLRHGSGALASAGDDSRRTSSATLLRRHAALQEELVADLVHISRVADRQLRATVTQVDADEAVAFVADSFRPLAMQQGIELHHAPAGAAMIFGDATRVILALSNLVWVAMSLAYARTRITIETERLVDGASISIEWTGDPLRPDQLDGELARLGEESMARDRVGMSCLVARQWIRMQGGRLRTSSTNARHRLVALWARGSSSVPPPSGASRS